MIRISSLGPRELKQVLRLLGQYSDRESEYSVLRKMQQLYIPLHRLSRALPLNCQFMPGIYVAVAQRKVLGLVWLSRDGRHRRRWKIDHVILDPNASTYDVGTQLLNYAINRYGGDGVQTFLAYVDQADSTGLALLKSCGFRRTTRMHYFSSRSPLALSDDASEKNEDKQTSPVSPGKAIPTPEGLREANGSDAELLAQLYNDIMPTEVRVCLEKSGRDFGHSILSMTTGTMAGERFIGAFSKRWVIADAARDSLLASIEINTRDYQDFHIYIMVHPGWENLYREALSFAVAQISGMSSQARLHTDCFDFCARTMETLEAVGFQRDGIAEVLVKDYWIPIEEKGMRLKSPLLLFSGRPSPAMN